MILSRLAPALTAFLKARIGVLTSGSPMNVDIERSSRFKNHARDQFDGWAPHYDRSLLNYFLFRPVYLMLLEEIARRRRTHPGPFALLDIGCGTGSWVQMIGRTGWPVRVVGLDYSKQMCAAAAEKNGIAGVSVPSIVAGDSEHLPFASESFDVVTCSNSFHHYPDQAAAVAEMRRVLKPGGCVIVVDGFRDNVVGWFVFDVIVGGLLERNVHHATWREVHTSFQRAGLRNIRRRKTNLLFPVVATIGEG